MVSCKHKAHSGCSVTTDDETNICDRIKQFNADGFIGFYSTLASSGLNNRLDSYKKDFNIEIFDREKIENVILSTKQYQLFKRYFPASYEKWIENKNKPSQILSSYKPLKCAVCGIDLLSPSNTDHGVIGLAINPKTDKYISCYAACPGNCDYKMQSFFASHGMYTAWNDVDDLMIPTIFLQKNMAIINQLHKSNLEFETQGLEEYKNILIAISQYVFRQQTEEELERAKILLMLPEGF